jgi:hypothetical protein
MARTARTEPESSYKVMEIKSCHDSNRLLISDRAACSALSSHELLLIIANLNLHTSIFSKINLKGVSGLECRTRGW